MTTTRTQVAGAPRARSARPASSRSKVAPVICRPTPGQRARGSGHQRDRLDRRAFDRDLARAHRDVVEPRPLAGIELPRLQRLEQRLGIEALRLDLDEAAEGVIVAVAEMRVVGGDRGQPPALVAELVEQIEAVAAVGLDRAAVIVDLHRMRRVERAAVVDRQLRPGGMGDRDEGAGRRAPARRAAARSRRGVGAAKSSGRPTARICQSSPTSGRHRMQLGADQRGETVGAEARGCRRSASRSARGNGRRAGGSRSRRPCRRRPPASGARAPSERVEWVCRLPRQKRPGVEKGAMLMVRLRSWAARDIPAASRTPSLLRRG